MTKNVRLALILILALALLCSATALVACDNNGIADLRVEGAKISFMKGDAFETGDDFKVYADYKDGSSVDVTADVEIRQENGMDMNVPGDYQITVIYGEKRTIYVVYVNDSEDILRKVELDTSAVKKQYLLGDVLSMDGISLTLTYENAQMVTFPVKTTSLVGFDVTVADVNGVVAENNVFTSMGTFTVTVAQGAVKASFNVTVDGVNISTVQGAIAVGGYYKNNVVSGDILVQGAMLHYGIDPETGKPPYEPGEPYTANVYEYAYGNRYTFYKMKETDWEPAREYHCGIDDEGYFITYLEGGAIKPSNNTNPSMINGAPISLWYSSATEYGVENALNNLYSHALQCSNNDLKELANEIESVYSFSFSGLEFRDSSADYYETTVTFQLGADYAITYVKIDQYYYENNSSLSGRDDYVASFTTDPETGKTTPGPEYTYRTIVTVTQQTGERTAKNEYSREMFKVTSYDLTYNGNVLTDESVLELNSGKIYKIKIGNVLPSTANFSLDLIYFDYEGNTGSSDFWLSNEHFSLSSDANVISLTTRHGGTWTLIFKTEKTVKKLTIKVTGDAPEEMNPKLLNNVSGTFYDGNEKAVSIGGAVYFYGAVERYANAAQTATIDSNNAEYATITAQTVNGIDCWKFTATQAGTYQITVVSDVAELTRCTFVFTVSESADYTELLSGTYTTQDQVGNIYRVTFTLNEQTLSGTALVTRTPTNEDNTPIEDEAVSETLNVYVDGMTIVVTHEKTDLIWVEFTVDANNNLILVDQRGGEYTLTRE